MGTLRRWSGTAWHPVKRWSGTRWDPVYGWDGSWKPSGPPSGPAVVGHTEAVDAAATSTLTPAMPAGLQAGDRLVLAMLSTDTSAGAAITPTVPAGWSVASPLANVGTMQRALYTAVYTPGLTPVVWTSSAARRMGYQLIAVRNAAAAPVVGVTNASASSAVSTAPSVTATGAGLVLRMYSKKDNTSTAVAPPAGHTLIGQALGTAGPAPHVMACAAPQAGAGATGTADATWTAASANWAAWTIAFS